MTETAVRVARLGKQFHIARLRRRHDSFRDFLSESLAGPFQRTWNLIRGHGGHVDAEETFWAFRDVSFEIRRGEVVGIIGRNGAGKTTLLKILSRITMPSEGFAEIQGRVGSLLEVGTGFHHELSGRENIFLNGAILGMRRREIERKLDEIIEFSEIGKFIDTPIKHYSSGMTMRLAFSVAAHLEPEIMMVDEVLAVGDAAFQRKCLGKMDEVSSHGRTVLFVSHNMGAVAQLCTRVIWLEKGRLRMDGPADEVVGAYLSEGSNNHGVWLNSEKPDESRDAWLGGGRITDPVGQPVTSTAFESPFRIEIDYRIHRAVRGLAILIKLVDPRGEVVFESTDTDDSPRRHQVREPGSYRSICHVPSHLLRPGRYHVTLMAFVAGVKKFYVSENVLTFDVTGKGFRMHSPRLGAVTPVLHWDVMGTNTSSECTVSNG